MEILPNFDLMCPLFLVVILLGVGLSVFWLWVLIDCIRNEPTGDNEKIMWVLIIVLAHTLGALLYVLIRRPARVVRCGR